MSRFLPVCVSEPKQWGVSFDNAIIISSIWENRTQWTEYNFLHRFLWNVRIRFINIKCEDIYKILGVLCMMLLQKGSILILKPVCVRKMNVYLSVYSPTLFFRAVRFSMYSLPQCVHLSNHQHAVPVVHWLQLMNLHWRIIVPQSP